MLVVETKDCSHKNPLSHEKLSDFVSLSGVWQASSSDDDASAAKDRSAEDR